MRSWKYPKTHKYSEIDTHAEMWQIEYIGVFRSCLHVIFLIIGNLVGEHKVFKFCKS